VPPFVLFVPSCEKKAFCLCAKKTFSVRRSKKSLSHTKPQRIEVSQRVHLYRQSDFSESALCAPLCASYLRAKENLLRKEKQKESFSHEATKNRSFTKRDLSLVLYFTNLFIPFLIRGTLKLIK
jgi:hypothetical protein